LDRPLSGRVLFEEVIRENLDVGCPDKVGLVFDRQIRRRGRRPTPGRFRTRILTEGVTPSLHVDYKHSKIKQYQCATNAREDIDVNGDLLERCCARDGGRPSAVALQGEAANHRQLRRDNARGGERDGKGPT